jgi:hypothetical protein
MIDCQKMNFSTTVGNERRKKAEMFLGKNAVTKILGIALYWLGGRRPEIAAELGIPENSLRTTVRVVLRDGPAAFEDRRHSYRQCTFLPPPRPAAEALTLALEDNMIAVRFGTMDAPLTIPAKNRVQSRVVLLSLVNSGLISPGDASEMLGLSTVHVRNLSDRLAGGDVEALRDKRHGQQKQHILTPEVKSEIVLQYSANAVTGRSTSSRAVAADISERCELALSDRTLRYCIAKLGLGKLTKDLPELVDRLKRGSNG